MLPNLALCLPGTLRSCILVYNQTEQLVSILNSYHYYNRLNLTTFYWSLDFSDKKEQVQLQTKRYAKN